MARSSDSRTLKTVVVIGAGQAGLSIAATLQRHGIRPLVLEKNSIGFGSVDQSDDAQDAAVKSFFAPEFRNRLDAVVQFKKLDQILMKSVTVKFLRELEEMLEPRNIVIEYDDETVDWLTKRGFTPSMGARPMARLINEKIKKPLSKQILFGEDVDLVKLSIQDDNINIRTDKIQT